MKLKAKTTDLRTILAAHYRQAAVAIGRRFDGLGAVGQEDALLDRAAALDEGLPVIVEAWRLQDALPRRIVLESSPTFTVHPDGTYTAGEPATIGADTAPGR